MKVLMSVGIALVFVMLVLSVRIEGQKTRVSTMNHTEWVATTLKQIQTIKSGMKRKDLLKLFVLDGGFGSGRTFILRDCPYIKVDVDFDGDTIKSISTPYLANPTLD